MPMPRCSGQSLPFTVTKMCPSALHCLTPAAAAAAAAAATHAALG